MPPLAEDMIRATISPYNPSASANCVHAATFRQNPRQNSQLDGRQCGSMWQVCDHACVAMDMQSSNGRTHATIKIKCIFDESDGGMGCGGESHNENKNHTDEEFTARDDGVRQSQSFV